MMVNGPLGNDEARGDLGVAQAFSEERKHVEFSCCEACWVLVRACTWSTRYAANPSPWRSRCMTIALLALPSSLVARQALEAGL